MNDSHFLRKYYNDLVKQLSKHKERFEWIKRSKESSTYKKYYFDVV